MNYQDSITLQTAKTMLAALKEVRSHLFFLDRQTLSMDDVVACQDDNGRVLQLVLDAIDVAEGRSEGSQTRHACEVIRGLGGAINPKAIGQEMKAMNPPLPCPPPIQKTPDFLKPFPKPPGVK